MFPSNTDKRKITCEPQENVQTCPNGQYINILAAKKSSGCSMCPAGTYADGTRASGESDGGLRIKCKQCPPVVGNDGRVIGTTSAAGATKANQCFPKYQLAAKGAEFCFGKSDVSLDENATNTAQVPALIPIQGSPPSSTTVGSDCKQAAADLKFKFGGAHLPLSGCIADAEQKVVWYILSEQDRKEVNDGAKPAANATDDNLQPPPTTVMEDISPVCRRISCDNEGQQFSFLQPNDNPNVDFVALNDRCGISAAAVDDALAKEFKTNSNLFFPIAAAIELVGVVAGYLYLIRMEYKDSFCSIPSKAHTWVFLGLALRLFDVMSNYAFLFVTLESLAFETAAGSQTDLIQTLCLVFTIIGTVIAPFDIWGSFQRLTVDENSHDTADTAKRDKAAWITALTTMIEDVPQLVINGVYIVIMGQFRDTAAGANVDPFDTISVVSLAASAANIVYNVWLLFSNYRRELLTLRSERRVDTL
jgi:hypothetical protein